MRFLGLFLLLGMGLAAPLANGQTRSFTRSPEKPPALPVDMAHEAKAKGLVSNRQVRVYRIDLEPGAQTDLDRHDHDFLVISLGESQFEFVGQASRFVMTMTDGEVQVMKGHWVHRISNTSHSPLHLVEVEIEKEIAPERAICGLNGKSCSGMKFAMNDDTNYTESRLFETPAVVIGRVEIAPGKGMPEHGHRSDHLMIALNDQNLTNAVVAGDLLEMTSHPGDATWMDAGIVHRIMNRGATPARFLTVDCK